MCRCWDLSEVVMAPVRAKLGDIMGHSLLYVLGLMRGADARAKLGDTPRLGHASWDIPGYVFQGFPTFYTNPCITLETTLYEPLI